MRTMTNLSFGASDRPDHKRDENHGGRRQAEFRTGTGIPHVESPETNSETSITFFGRRKTREIRGTRPVLPGKGEKCLG